MRGCQPACSRLYSSFGARGYNALGFARTGRHRHHFLTLSLRDLAGQLAAHGSGLLQLSGAPLDVLLLLARAIDATKIFCEAIAAPEEEAEIAALRAKGVEIEAVWQSSLYEPDNLPFARDKLPSQFTTFRLALEKAKAAPPVPLPLPAKFPPLPDPMPATAIPRHAAKQFPIEPDSRSSFPYHTLEFAGGETAAAKHLQQYFARKLAHSYKATRNELMGYDYSSKFSPWLATGALSAPTVHAALKRFEAEHGGNDGTYWLWFELLWRDYFRFLHLKHGRALYRGRGLSNQPVTGHNAGGFERWCRGETGEALIDAGMRELAATGYLSNRMRQIVASYLIYDLMCDWRAGAAWFESQLIDYDVYSNQGNWLYIAGRGTDPRGGRRFNPEKQAREYDADGRYRLLWRSPE